jgi:CRISPR-associated protein Csb2
MSSAPLSAVSGLRLWRLHGPHLPHVLLTLRTAEAARAAVIAAQEAATGTRRLHACLHGEGDGGAPHAHAFWLPQDLDHDGLIDHLAVHAPGGLCPACAALLDSLAAVTVTGVGRLALAPVTRGAGVVAGVVGPARLWVSAVPFFGPWNPGQGSGGLPRRGRDAMAQLARAIAQSGRSLPAAEVAALPAAGNELVAFLNGRRADAAAARLPRPVAGMFALAFAAPVAGPLAFGLHAHFGLGRFRPGEAADG